MNALQGQRRTYIVIYVLRQVQQVILRGVALLKGALHFYIQILQAAVASDRDGTGNCACHIYGNSVTGDVRSDRQIGAQDI